MPSASSAATQNTNIVTAAFNSFCRPLLRPRRNYLAGAGAPGAASGATGAAEAPDLPGIFSFWPTLILSVEILFAPRIAFTVVPKRFAMPMRLSPDFTV